MLGLGSLATHLRDRAWLQPSDWQDSGHTGGKEQDWSYRLHILAYRKQDREETIYPPTHTGTDATAASGQRNDKRRLSAVACSTKSLLSRHGFSFHQRGREVSISFQIPWDGFVKQRHAINALQNFNCPITLSFGSRHSLVDTTKRLAVVCGSHIFSGCGLLYVEVTAWSHVRSAHDLTTCECLR